MPLPNPFKAASRGIRRFIYSAWGGLGGASPGFRLVLPDNDVNYVHVLRRPWTNAVVSVCANFLAASVADLDLYVHRDKGKGKNKEIENHPLTRLLDRPNPFYTYGALWHFTVRELSGGEAFWVKVRSGSGAVVQVIPVPSESMVPVSYDPAELITHYRYTAAGVTEEYPRSEVVHFVRDRDPDNPMRGLSPYHALGRELFTDNALAGMKAALSHNLGMPGLLISTKDPNAFVHEDDIAQIREGARVRFTGRRRGEPWVMRGAWQVDKLSWNLREMDASNWSQEPAERLCAALGLNAMAVNLPTKDRTFANFEEANQSAWRKGVLPLLDFLAVTLDHQLLPDLGDPGTQRVLFDTDDVVELREDQKALYDRVVAAYKGEILKRSEAREELGYDSGPEDDVYFIGAGETPDVPPAGTIDGNPAVQVAAAQAQGKQPPTNGNGKVPANGKHLANGKRPAAKALDGVTDGSESAKPRAEGAEAAGLACAATTEKDVPALRSVKAADAPEGDDRRPFPSDAELGRRRATVRSLIAEYGAAFRADAERLMEELNGPPADAPAEAKALPAAAAARVARWLAGLKAGLNKLLTAAALALGGDRAADAKALQAAIEKQEAFADGFADDILSGKQPLDGTLAARAESYAASAHAAAEMSLADIASADGLTLAARVLGGAEHHCAECPDLAALGFVPIDSAEFVGIGDTPCGPRCRCSLEFR